MNKLDSRLVMCIVAMMLLVPPFLTYADDGQCVPDGGPHIFTYNANYDLKNVTNTAAGTIINDAFVYQLEGSYYAKCPGANVNNSALIVSRSDLPIYKRVGDVTWYKVNDNLAVSMQGFVGGLVNKYFPVPFLQQDNCTYPTCTQNSPWSSGGRGKVSIMIIKPFVGISIVDTVINYTQVVWGGSYSSTQPIMSELMMHGTVISPQSCELNAGQVVNMDFGNIGASDFSQAGAGNRPDGVNPQTRNINIQCKNIDAQSLLSLRIEADKVAGNAIVSDNPDLGFVVADGKQKPLTPNNTGSKISIGLDESGSATIPISAWPVSVTGKKPSEGRFTSEGYLRVDFD